MEIKIEKGIPLIPRTTGILNVIKALKVGDSFIVEKTQRPNIYLYGKLAGFKMATRTEGDKLRVWRVA